MGLGKKLRRLEKHVIRPVVHTVPAVVHAVPAVVPAVVKAVPAVAKGAERLVRRGVLPVVLGAGRKKVTTTHVQADFQSEHITLVVTVGGEVEVQEVTSPCADGSHNIVDCAQPLEIVLNDGSYVFNDKYCTNCGEHFPFLQSDPEAEIKQ